MKNILNKAADNLIHDFLRLSNEYYANKCRGSEPYSNFAELNEIRSKFVETFIDNFFENHPGSFDLEYKLIAGNKLCDKLLNCFILARPSRYKKSKSILWVKLLISMRLKKELLAIFFKFVFRSYISKHIEKGRSVRLVLGFPDYAFSSHDNSDELDSFGEWYKRNLLTSEDILISLDERNTGVTYPSIDRLIAVRKFNLNYKALIFFFDLFKTLLTFRLLSIANKIYQFETLYFEKIIKSYDNINSAYVLFEGFSIGYAHINKGLMEKIFVYSYSQNYCEYPAPELYNPVLSACAIQSSQITLTPETWRLAGNVIGSTLAYNNMIVILWGKDNKLVDDKVIGRKKIDVPLQLGYFQKSLAEEYISQRLSNNNKILLVFDSKPKQEEESEKNHIYGAPVHKENVILKFITDIIEVAVSNDYYIILKLKRTRQKSRYNEEIDKLSRRYSGRILIENSFSQNVKLIKAATAVVSFPYSTTYNLAYYLEKKSIYYLPEDAPWLIKFQNVVVGKSQLERELSVAS